MRNRTLLMFMGLCVSLGLLLGGLVAGKGFVQMERVRAYSGPVEAIPQVESAPVPLLPSIVYKMDSEVEAMGKELERIEAELAYNDAVETEIE